MIPIDQQWSWGLALIGITGIWLVGKHLTIGWAILTLLQIPWILYAIVSGQWGFILSASVMAIVNGNNWRKWHKEKKENESRKEG